MRGNGNGKDSSHAQRSSVEELTKDQAKRLAERRSKALIGKSYLEAKAMVQRGELRGTAAETQIKGFQFLLGD